MNCAILLFVSNFTPFAQAWRDDMARSLAAAHMHNWQLLRRRSSLTLSTLCSNDVSSHRGLHKMWTRTNKGRRQFSTHFTYSRFASQIATRLTNTCIIFFAYVAWGIAYGASPPGLSPPTKKGKRKKLCKNRIIRLRRGSPHIPCKDLFLLIFISFWLGMYHKRLIF